jgi:siroheme synthase-like protein
MGFYPVFLELSGRRCLVVGGGLVAERRTEGLLAVGATVTVISPTLTSTLVALAADGRIRHSLRAFEPGDLDGVDLAFAATDRGEVNAALFREARTRGVWVNAADDPAHCTFILPAVVRRGDLTVAVSTGGTSPALARAIREELEGFLTAEYATLARIAAEARRELRAAGRVADAETWRRALGPEVRRLIVERGWKEAKRHLLERLGVAAWV